MSRALIDLTFDASEEAKICLNCNKLKCTPNKCLRFEQMSKKLKQEQTTPKRKKLKSGGKFKNEGLE